MKLEKRDIIALLIMIALCLVVRLIFYTGVYVNDDVMYIDHAMTLAHGFNIWENGGSQLAFRIGMVIPLVVFFKLFGFHEYTFAAYSIFCSLGACTCIFLAAFRLWGLRVAILSSLSWVLFPLQICYDTQLSTSPQLAFSVAAALLCFIEAQRLQKDEVNKASSRKSSFLYFCCGIIMGLGWLVSSLLALIVFAAFSVIFFLRPPLKSIGLILAGFIVVFCLELTYCAILSGNPLARVHSIDSTEAVIQSCRDEGYLPRVMFDLVKIDYIHHEGHFGIQWYLFILCTIYVFARRERTAMALAAGVWLVIAYLQWGVISPDLTPITRYIRYLSLITPFVCIVFGWSFEQVFAHRSRFLSLASQALFLLYCIHCIVIAVAVIDKNRDVLSDYREASRIIISRRLPEPVYTDFRTWRYLNLYSGRHLNLQEIEAYIGSDRLPEKGTLLKRCSDISRNMEYRENETPSWYRTPPSHWVLYAKIITRRVYETELNPEIYIITPSPP